MFQRGKLQKEKMGEDAYAQESELGHESLQDADTGKVFLRGLQGAGEMLSV